MFFLFKQKTAYEMRISDWSSDVCSSDLALHHLCGDRVDGHFQMAARQLAPRRTGRAVRIGDGDDRPGIEPQENPARQDRRRLEICAVAYRKSVGEGKSVSVRVDHGGRGLLRKKKHETN